MASWSFLINHARTLLCIAHDPGVRFRDIAVEVSMTERSAHGIVADLVDAGYLAKQKTERRNRYRIQEHLPLRDSVTRERTIGQMLDVLAGRTPAAENQRQAWFTMADWPRSNTATHDRVSGHPHRPGTCCERRPGRRHWHIGPQGTGGTAGARGAAAAAGNWIVGDDTLPNRLAAGRWRGRAGPRAD